MTADRICPDCGRPVSTHAMFQPPRCPVVRFPYHYSETSEPKQLEYKMPTVHIAWIAFSPAGTVHSWQPPQTMIERFRHWRRRRAGWKCYDGDGRLT